MEPLAQGLAYIGHSVLALLPLSLPLSEARGRGRGNAGGRWGQSLGRGIPVSGENEGGL